MNETTMRFVRFVNFVTKWFLIAFISAFAVYSLSQLPTLLDIKARCREMGYRTGGFERPLSSEGICVISETYCTLGEEGTYQQCK